MSNLAYIVINGTDLRAQIQSLISRHVGVVGSILNIKPILQMILEHVFYGDFMCDKEYILREICIYNIPSDPAKQLLDGIMQTVNTAVNNTRAQFPLNSCFDFELDNGCNIKITVYDAHATMLRPSEPAPTQEEIEMGMENGDYYPESMRRAVGI